MPLPAAPPAPDSRILLSAVDDRSPTRFDSPQTPARRERVGSTVTSAAVRQPSDWATVTHTRSVGRGALSQRAPTHRVLVPTHPSPVRPRVSQETPQISHGSSANPFASLAELPDDWAPPVRATPTVLRGASGRQFTRTLHELHQFERRRLAAGGTPLPTGPWADATTSVAVKSAFYDYVDWSFHDISVPCPKISVAASFGRSAFWDRVSLARLRFQGDKRSYVRVSRPPDIWPSADMVRPDRSDLQKSVPPIGAAESLSPRPGPRVPGGGSSDSSLSESDGLTPRPGPRVPGGGSSVSRPEGLSPRPGPRVPGGGLSDSSRTSSDAVRPDARTSRDRALLTLHVPPRGEAYDHSHASRQASYRDVGAHYRGPSGTTGLRVNCERLLEFGAPADEVARVRSGYEVALHSEPPRYHGRNYGDALTFPEKVTEETKRMLESGFVEGPLLYTPHIVQSLGGVWKPEKQKWRTIVNGTGSGVNPCSLNLSTQYDLLESVIEPLVPGARMSLFDLTDAFLNWPYTEEHSELWGFMDPGSHEYFRYRYMAFGGRQSPSVQQRWARILKGIVNQHGLRYCKPGSRAASYDGFACSGAFVDDFFLQHNPNLTKEESDEQFASVLQLLDHLGFAYKPSKNSWPATRACYLGFVIDTVRQSVGITTERASALDSDIENFCSTSPAGSPVGRRAAAQLIGKLQWVAQIIPQGQQFLQHSYRMRDAFRDSATRGLPAKRQWSPTVMVSSSAAALSELQGWRARLSLLVETPIFLSNLTMPSGFWRGDLSESDQILDSQEGLSREHVHVITGDACGDACGGWFGHRRMAHFFTPPECAPVRSSNYRELKTVLLMLEEWGDLLSDSRVLVRTDNTTTVSCVARGFHPDPHLGRVSAAIYAFCHDHGIQLAARHIPGLRNGLADRLSRQLDVYRRRDEGDWMFRHDEFGSLQRLSGRVFDVDACADPVGRNAHCPQYWSVVDSMLDHSWRGLHVWCNPDWRLIGAALRHFHDESGRAPTTTSAVFLLPAWPSAPWWRLLRDSQLLAFYPAGSELFTAPDHRLSVTDLLSRPRSCFGGTKWGTIAVVLGSRHTGIGPTDTSPGGRRGYCRLGDGGCDGAPHPVALQHTILSGDTAADAELLRRVRPCTLPGLRGTAGTAGSD